MWINSRGINNCKVVHYENCTVYTGKNAGLWLVHIWTAVFLEHLREYVLHGLDPGLDWASFWPAPSVFHVATPHSVSCCLSQMDQVSHLTPSLLSGWLITIVQANNTTTLYDTHGHTIYTSHRHYFSSFLPSFFLLTLLPPSLAGRLIQTLPV
jgi:hypothetical protein